MDIIRVRGPLRVLCELQVLRLLGDAYDQARPAHTTQYSHTNDDETSTTARSVYFKPVEPLLSAG